MNSQNHLNQFKEINYVSRRTSSIQDFILMPPPKAVLNTTYSNVTRSDFSEDLKRNLAETSINAFTNSRLYKDILDQLTNEDNIKTDNMPQFLISSSNQFSASSSSFSYSVNTNNINLNPVCNSNTISSKDLYLNKFFNHDSTSNHIANVYRIIKKQENREDSSFNANNSSLCNNSKVNSNCNSLSLKECSIFKQRLLPPKTIQDIDNFVMHLISLLKKYEFGDSFTTLIQLEARYNDYKIHKLDKDYFKEYLVKIQANIYYKLEQVLQPKQDVNYNNLNNIQFNLKEEKDRDNKKEINLFNFDKQGGEKENLNTFQFLSNKKKSEYVNLKYMNSLNKRNHISNFKLNPKFSNNKTNTYEDNSEFSTSNIMSNINTESYSKPFEYNGVKLIERNNSFDKEKFKKHPGSPSVNI